MGTREFFRKETVGKKRRRGLGEPQRTSGAPIQPGAIRDRSFQRTRQGARHREWHTVVEISIRQNNSMGSAPKHHTHTVAPYTLCGEHADAITWVPCNREKGEVWSGREEWVPIGANKWWHGGTATSNYVINLCGEVGASFMFTSFPIPGVAINPSHFCKGVITSTLWFSCNGGWGSQGVGNQ